MKVGYVNSSQIMMQGDGKLAAIIYDIVNNIPCILFKRLKDSDGEGS